MILHPRVRDELDGTMRIEEARRVFRRAVDHLRALAHQQRNLLLPAQRFESLFKTDVRVIIPFTPPPAQHALPAPVNTIARTSGSAPGRPSASMNARSMSSENAFRLRRPPLPS
jgi:hypothetical protein